MAAKKANPPAHAPEKENIAMNAPSAEVVSSAQKKPDILQELSEPFPQEVERILRKGGAELIYIPVSEVINRLNRVLGIGGWSSEVVSCERDSLDPDFIVAHVRITANSLGGVIKDGVGGQKIKRTKNGDIVDLGDEFKGAVSDALKKAAQQFGIGLYLARSEDALVLEARQDSIEELSPEAQKIANMYKNFMNLREKLDDTGLEQVRSYWKESSGGRPVPKPSEFTEQELEGLITEVTRILLGGEEAVAG
jgi:hypothetical protein